MAQGQQAEDGRGRGSLEDDDWHSDSRWRAGEASQGEGGRDACPREGSTHHRLSEALVAGSFLNSRSDPWPRRRGHPRR